MQAQRAGRRILFLVTEDWHFCSHRLQLASAVRSAGYDVAVAARVQKHGDVLRAAGLTLFPLRLTREGRNPLHEARAAAELIGVYRKFKPELVHHVALKPMLYGSIAAAFTGVERRVNAMAGRGFVFVSDHPFARALRPVVRASYRAMLNKPNVRVLLQNPDDCAMWSAQHLARPDQIVMIRGSGVDTSRFVPRDEQAAAPIVTLPSRLLWDKGVGEFVEAARILRAEGIAATFRLAGDTDPANPSAVPRAQLQAWHDEGIIEWLGWCDDMASVYQDSHIVCLPSYAEGLPKALLEAAACGRPLVAADVPGCREIVRHGENGLLAEVKSARALADALRSLVSSRELRARMGAMSRSMAVKEFSIEHVIDATIELYDTMFGLAEADARGGGRAPPREDRVSS